MNWAFHDAEAIDATPYGRKRDRCDEAMPIGARLDEGDLWCRPLTHECDERCCQPATVRHMFREVYASNAQSRLIDDRFDYGGRGGFENLEEVSP